MYAMTHSYVWHNSFICWRTPLHYLWDITHVWHDSFMCVTWHSFIRVARLIEKAPLCTTCANEYDSLICATWLIHMCDMTHSYVWHDSIREHSFALPVSMNKTHLYVWRTTIKRVTWLIHMCDMTPSCVWHDSFICVACLIHVCDMTHSGSAPLYYL